MSKRKTKFKNIEIPKDEQIKNDRNWGYPRIHPTIGRQYIDVMEDGYDGEF